MSDVNKEDLNSEVVPFFARYLEGQLTEELSDEEAEALSGGRGGRRWRKYRYDHDDSSGGGSVTTAKYPSDNEDGSGGGGVTTLKYPSDNEEYSQG